MVARAGPLAVVGLLALSTVIFHNEPTEGTQWLASGAPVAIVGEGGAVPVVVARQPGGGAVIPGGGGDQKGGIANAQARRRGAKNVKLPARAGAGYEHDPGQTKPKDRPRRTLWTESQPAGTAPELAEDVPLFARCLAQKRGSGRAPLWVVLMGDSNMRYKWRAWTQGFARLSVLGSTKMTKEGTDYAEAWSDMEYLAELKGVGELRVSMRFLHSFCGKIPTVFDEPHRVSLAGGYTKADLQNKQEEIDALAAKLYNASDPDAVRPSSYAIWATQNNTRIDTTWRDTDPKLHKRLQKYADRDPDLFIMSESWGGCPSCDEWDATLAMFKKYPDSRVVWAPVWVTTRSEKRRNCFAPLMNSSEASGANYRVLDFREKQKEELNQKAEVLHLPDHHKYIVATWRAIMEAVCEFPKDNVGSR
eukprot:TRINITY_DN22286_c0_g1_i1.p1 TRINITY_DN22286_c0_g1~~TRINITY_DN22286_c0_g1_i1.p1  ORF type:complete len:442 (+),score=86.89 TRINITY_DN22286_c0_g1_i1:71-1327(+)